MHPLLNIAVKAARSASKIIIKNFERLDLIKIDEKGSNDFVSEVDQLAEQEIIRIIHDAYPQHAILGEEGGSIGENEYTWIIDPLDGTVNYIHGYPRFAVSIAVQHRNKILCGVTYDPLGQELYTAECGAGAYCNSKRIRVSQRKQIHGSLLGIGFAHSNEKYLKDYLTTLCEIELHTAGIRRSGSSALDFAYVASGKLDGLWEFNLKPWDLMVGSLLVKEAGGMLSDFTGGDKYFTTGNVIAGNLYIHKELLCSIQKCLADQKSN
jgi:myo-inositol-1(or 4)-monophosphatase